MNNSAGIRPPLTDLASADATEYGAICSVVIDHSIVLFHSLVKLLFVGRFNEYRLVSFYALHYVTTL